MTKKYNLLMPLFLLTGASCASFFTLLNSIERGETWRTAVAAVGFIGFFFLNLVVVIRFFRNK